MGQWRAPRPVAANAAAADFRNEFLESLGIVHHGTSVSNFSDAAKPNLARAVYG
jgi:hypothetical protein